MCIGRNTTRLLHGLLAHWAHRPLLVPHEVARHQGELLQQAQHELQAAGHGPVGEAVLGPEAGIEGGDDAGGAGHGALAQPQEAAHRHQLLAELLLGRGPRKGDVRVEVELPNSAVI